MRVKSIVEKNLGHAQGQIDPQNFIHIDPDQPSLFHNEVISSLKSEPSVSLWEDFPKVQRLPHSTFEQTELVKNTCDTKFTAGLLGDFKSIHPESREKRTAGADCIPLTCLGTETAGGKDT